jgi:hypothetical protein
MVLESEDEMDTNRARMVLSMGHEVVEPGYSRLLRDAVRATDRGEESSNPNKVGRVHREYDTDRRTYRVTRDSRGNQDRYSGRWVDRVTWDSQGNRDAGSGQQVDRVTWVSRGNSDSNPKSGNSSRVMENSANTKGRDMGNSANMESWVMENLANTENRVMQNSGGGAGSRNRKRCCSKQKASSTMVPKGYYQDTKT